MIDHDEPAIYIYDNPEYENKENIDIYSEIETKKGKNQLLEQMKDRGKNIELLRITPNDVIDRLEIEVLSLVNNYKSNYLENKILLRDFIEKSSSVETKRVCLMYLLGGGTLGYHFLNENGSLKSMLDIDEEILKLLSWKGMSFNDYFSLNRIWKNMNYSSWVLLKVMNRSEFVKKYLHYWFKNIYENKLPLTSASVFFLYYSTNIFEKIVKVITSVFIIGYLSIYLYEAFYTREEVNIINTSVDNLEHNDGIDKETKKKILLFKNEYIKLEQEIKKMRILPDQELEKEIHEQLSKTYFLGIKRKQNRLITFLIKYLQTPLPLSVLYMEMRHQGIIIPLAIYFFNYKGEVRPVRDIVCCILIISRNFKPEDYSHLKNPGIVSRSRKENLVGEFNGGSNLKNIYSRKKKKSDNKKKTAKHVVI